VATHAAAQGLSPNTLSMLLPDKEVRDSVSSYYTVSGAPFCSSRAATGARGWTCVCAWLGAAPLCDLGICPA